MGKRIYENTIALDNCLNSGNPDSCLPKFQKVFGQVNYNELIKEVGKGQNPAAYQQVLNYASRHNELSNCANGSVNACAELAQFKRNFETGVFIGVGVGSAVRSGGIQAAGFTKKGQANLNNSNRNQQAYTFEERKKEIPTNLTRHTEVDGVKVRIYSGHSYNRAHATGDVRDTGLSMDTIDNAIVRDVTNNVNISKLPVFPNKTGQKAQEITIDVQGHSITYRAAKLPSGEVTINTYYLTPK